MTPRFGRVLTAMISPFDEDGSLDIEGRLISKERKNSQNGLWSKEMKVWLLLAQLESLQL